jgi:hypothetical protein
MPERDATRNGVGVHKIVTVAGQPTRGKVAHLLIGEAGGAVGR